MKFAVSLRSGEVVCADYKISRFDRYKCPYCDSKVILRAGYYREPYFAHSSSQNNQAKLNCEEYHTGFGYYPPTPITNRVISIAESKVESERQEFSTTLCVGDSEKDFRLYLSIPNIPPDSENPISLRELQKIKMPVTAGGILIGQLHAIELFTGGMKTRFYVKPTEKDYEIAVVNQTSLEADLDFCDGSIKGLSPKGNLFGKTQDEWIRIFPNSEVEWGAEFYYVGLANISVPNNCFPKEIAVRDGYTRKWKLWRIKLPEEPDEKIEDWLNKIDYSVAEARWKLQLLSVPKDYDASENVYYFDESDPILFKATSPFSKSETALICESTELTQEKLLKTDTENNCFFSVKDRFDKIYLRDFPKTEINAIFTDDTDSHSLSERISNLPSISLKLNGDFFEGFTDDETTNTILTREQFNPADIEIFLEPEELNDFVERRVNIHFVGDALIFKNQLTFKEAKCEILNILLKKYRGTLAIDAGSLGIISLNLVNDIINERFEPQPFNRISGWLSVVAASVRRDGEYTGSNSDFRKSMTEQKPRRNILQSRSPYVTAQARAMLKRKKR